MHSGINLFALQTNLKINNWFKAIRFNCEYKINLTNFMTKIAQKQASKTITNVFYLTLKFICLPIQLKEKI
jgi:hypothetical protein